MAHEPNQYTLKAGLFFQRKDDLEITKADQWFDIGKPDGFTIDTPTKGRILVRGLLAYRTTSTGSVWVRVAVDGSIEGTIECYVPLDSQVPTTGAKRFIPCLVGLDDKQIIERGEHNIQIQVKKGFPEDDKSLLFNVSAEGDGFLNAEVIFVRP